MRGCRPPEVGADQGGLEPAAYPDYPDTFTAETARSFAREFEYAYRRNEFIQNNEDTWYDELHVDIWETEVEDERDGGYVVTVVGEMQYAVADRPESATGTERPSGGGPFTAWFYLTDRYAIRYENPSAEEPNFEYGEVVVCDG